MHEDMIKNNNLVAIRTENQINTTADGQLHMMVLLFI